MTIILVEGCDGSGKSTLVEQARTERGHYFIKARASRNQPNVPAALKYLAWIKQCPHDLVLDRLHFLSDRVYGPILRGEDVFKGLPLSFGLASMSAIIYCRPPEIKIQENAARGRHLQGVMENLHDLVVAYDTIMQAIHEKQIAPILFYNYMEDEPLSFWRHVWSRAKENDNAYVLR